MAKSTLRKHRHLAAQTIDETGPGTVLADFETLLEFIGDGLRSTGKYHLLPQAQLFELDERMTRPLRPRLKRPQLRSFPHLSGLHLLLRATQLGVPQGEGKSSGRLALDQALLEQWRSLNATERYFNLFEAWLRRSYWESLGLDLVGQAYRVGLNACEFWSRIPARGRRFSREQSRQEYRLMGTERTTTLALLEAFGLMAVELHNPEEGQNWCVRAIRHTPFGDELLGTVLKHIERKYYYHRDDDDDEEPEFGAWQPLLQPYFPEWVHNLKLPEREFRDGVYYFKVSLGEPWRRIAMPADTDLDDLADCIIKAFDFDGDHLYAFNLKARDGHRFGVEHPCVEDAESHTDEVAVGDLPLDERESMEFHYDFGADWRFQVQLEKVDPKGKISKPAIVARRGKAPPEYDYGEW